MAEESASALCDQKSPWRPIITVEIDKRECGGETVLGVDGQAPNAKEGHHLPEAELHSKVEIKVWHRSQSKRKGKKRNLVATASHSLNELLKRQTADTKIPIKVPLTCPSLIKRGTSSRDKQQNRPQAVLHLKVKHPSNLSLPADTDEDNDSVESWTMPPTPTDPSPPPTLRQRKRRRSMFDRDTSRKPEEPLEPPEPKKYRGYDCGDESGSEDDAVPIPPYSEWEDIEDCDEEQVSSFPNPVGWIWGSLLPQYTEKIPIPPTLSWPERLITNFTVYAQLKYATQESQFDEIFKRLQMEWTYTGGLLVALAAVDTAVFSISPGSIFQVDSSARAAIATSSVASGLGIATDAWFLLRYWCDLESFLTRAKDVYGTYFFFALSARVPSICMFISAVSLMGFLALVAFQAWPMGVLVICFFIGLLMTLQFLVFGVHFIGSKMVAGGRGSVQAIRRLTG
ncbi:hypothetical protein C8J56DRAFT_972115 [Mycena floridula]|nr:hypothetical protein C8J56DRAFT_972115 [Mycena floridula]